MQYAFESISPKSKGKYEIVFSNGVNTEIINVASLAKDTWCLYNYGGKRPLKFYSSVEDLVIDFIDDLNKE